MGSSRALLSKAHKKVIKMLAGYEKCSLVLVSRGKVVYSSERGGIRPLFDCLKECMGKHSDCTLHDKVVGLAAANLVVYSGMIKEVVTGVCSEPAKSFLQEKSIGLKADKIVRNILRKDGEGICPMEQKALSLEDMNKFFSYLDEHFEK